MYIAKLIRSLFAAAVFLGVLSAGYAQVVSSGITGTVVADDGRPIAGASVTVRHEPTNTVSTAVTRDNGRFSFRGLPVGGPFTVSATAEGATIGSVSGVTTLLGEDV
ncbi:MAG TPA: carboxypeptidase-like regulatory domain-containing protein, partial [Opitutus sp.]|nr:carboxypeptidase-like regulatory domain-containing protein [Opitutus sp.]